MQKNTQTSGCQAAWQGHVNVLQLLADEGTLPRRGCDAFVYGFILGTSRTFDFITGEARCEGKRMNGPLMWVLGLGPYLGLKAF